MSTMKVQRFVFNPFAENTYLLSDQSKDCIIIDPGCYTREEKNSLKDHIVQQELRPVRLINTHAHLDHVFGNDFVQREWGLTPEMHRLDLPTLEMAPRSAMLYGIPDVDPMPEPVDFLEEGDTVSLGDQAWEVVLVPGHAPGHIVLINHEEQTIIGGDVLFQGSIGRTDLPGGDHDTLIRNIREKLFVLDDAYRIWPGHGQPTTIGEEKQYNPFVGGGQG